YENGQGKIVPVESETIQAMAEIKKSWESSGYRSRMRDELRDQISDGLISNGKWDYWTSSTEVFARTFERYVQWKLESNGRKNTYLIGLETKSHKGGGLWPTMEEVEQM